MKLRIGVVLRGEGMKPPDIEQAAGRSTRRTGRALEDFSRGLVNAGADALIVHARKAVLGGCRRTRTAPCRRLRFDVVERLRADARRYAGDRQRRHPHLRAGAWRRCRASTA